MPTVRALLARVVGRLASDGASPLVRLGAVEGLSLLLECPESHSVLKAMLPVRRKAVVIVVLLLLLLCFCFCSSHIDSLAVFLVPDGVAHGNLST